MERTVWSDERIDDRFAHFDRNMDQFREEMRDFRAEMRDFRSEMRDMRTEMHAGFVSLRRDMLLAFLTMTTMLVATMATILAKTL